MPDIYPGCIVRSKAGRDKGAYYLVIDEEEGKVLVANGRNRPITNAKKKNRSHLQHSYQGAAAVKVKLANGEKLTDEDIRAALNKFYAAQGE